MEYPNRKLTRLHDYDYSSAGAYFITICTKDRKCLFWEDVGAIIDRPNGTHLSPMGKITAQCVQDIEEHYPAIHVDHYVIMPNHIHLLLQIQTDTDGRSMIAPTISTVVRLFKGAVSHKIGKPIWQKGFYDHVIRGDADYQKIWTYIENNPAKWLEDRFYTQITNSL